MSTSLLNRREARRVIPRPSEARRLPTSRPGPVAPTANVDRQANGWEEPFVAACAPFSIVAALAGFAFIGLTDRANTTAAVVVIPILATIVLLAVNRWIRPRYGQGFASILLAGLGFRFLAAIPRFQGGVDAVVYQREGARLAENFRAFDFAVDTGRPVPGTGSLRYASGLVNAVTGSSYIATFLIFATLAFAGQVFFLLAFRPWLTRKQFRLAALLVMFFPSLAFWPSSIGKEAAILFGLGLLVYGASRVYRREVAGIPALVAGLLAIGVVRPHIAMIALSALVIGLFTRQRQGRPRIVLHSVVLAMVIVGSMIIAGASATLFGLESLDGIEDVSAALDFTQARTSRDSSQFLAARISSPLDYPWAAVTVLFRPFPWEAATSMAMLTSFEGVLLAGLSLRALGGLIVDRSRIMRSGPLLFACAYSAVFIFLFSAIGNFGILSRQRAQLLPFVLVLVAIGLAADRRGSTASPTDRVGAAG